MSVTIEITSHSVGEYLQVLAVLDQAEEDGELDFEWTASPAPSSIAVIAAHVAVSSEDE